MRLQQVPSSRPDALPLGEMRFVASFRVPDVCTDLANQKFLVVGAPAGPLAPAGLRRRIDDAVETELATRGALPAAIGVDAELASCIRDQVFRTRALGSTGLAIALPPLSELTDPDGRLNVDDSAALLAWTRATAELPVVLLASDADRMVPAYAPMPLERILASEGRPAPEAPPPAVDEATWLEASREPPMEDDPFDMTPRPARVARSREEGLLLHDRHLRSEIREMTPAPPTVGRARTTPPPPVVEVANEGHFSMSVRRTDTLIEATAPSHIARLSETMESVVSSDGIHESTAHYEEPSNRIDVRMGIAERSEDEAPRGIKPGILKGKRRRAETLPPPPKARDAEEALRPEERVSESVTIPVRARDTSAARVVDAAEWRNFAMELDAARGPKPVRVIEQLFMTRYMPLIGALARGEADGAVRNVADGWAQAFEQSYTDAFSAMRVTGKRPMMTFDAPEIANRIARLNGARSVKLLLVDGMSFDIGERVVAELRARASGNGVCVDQMLLWSALPTVTSMQMALLARGGPEALREVTPPSDQEHEIARGRAVGTLRRERAGARELMKLDLVEARLRTAGPAYDERLDTLADEVASVVLRFMEALPPRTLVFVFGDHGFRLPCSVDGRSTGPATQGGASPEEVLVPAYAWLSGGVH